MQEIKISNQIWTSQNLDVSQTGMENLFCIFKIPEEWENTKKGACVIMITI